MSNGDDQIRDTAEALAREILDDEDIQAALADSTDEMDRFSLIVGYTIYRLRSQ